MKKLIALIVCAMMLLSMIPMVALPAGAADIEGDWMTYRQANDYNEPDPDTGEEPSYRPAPGYHYTDEGFSTIAADYTGTSPFMTVQSKEKHSLKDGLYLQFRVDQFSYKGPEGNCDEWIALTLWDSVKVAPGTTTFGAGWVSLIRGNGDGGDTQSFSCYTTKTTEDTPGKWGDLGQYTFKPELDDEGREIYTLEVEWTGSEYEVSVCGVKLDTSAAITEKLEEIDSNGDFYVGISMQSSLKDGTASLTILKYGTSEANATTPVGTDSKDPEPNINVVADMMDPTTIETNMPAVFMDATTNSAASLGYGDRAYAQGDNSFHLTAPAADSFISWTIRKDTSYAVEDFPVFAMLVRDYWYAGTLWYYCGDIVSATLGYQTSFNSFDGVYFDGDDMAAYTLILVDLTEMCSGRINGFRIDFNGVDMNDPEFDICYMGCFRSEEEATAYGAAHLGVKTPAENGNEDDTNAPETNAGTDGEQGTTADPTETTPVGTTAPNENVTKAPDETDKPKEGCGSVIGFSAVGLIALAGAYFVKKKD